MCQVYAETMVYRRAPDLEVHHSSYEVVIVSTTLGFSRVFDVESHAARPRQKSKERVDYVI